MLRSSLLASVYSSFVKLISLTLVVAAASLSFKSASEENPDEKLLKEMTEKSRSALIGIEKPMNDATDQSYDRLLKETELNSQSSQSEGPNNFEEENTRLKSNFSEYSRLLPEAVSPYTRDLTEAEPISEDQKRFGISSKEMAEIRSAALKHFQLDKGVQGLIFVSRSMPNGLIRAYALDAERYGFTLVYRGPDKDSIDILGTAKEWARQFHTTSDRMAIQMDPRAFDAYEIKYVPTLVLTNDYSLDLCPEGPVEIIKYLGKNLPHKRCKPKEEDTYCKISGSVSTQWALTHMAENGCDLANKYVEADQHDVQIAPVIVSESSWEKAQKAYSGLFKTNKYEEVTMEYITEETFK